MFQANGTYGEHYQDFKGLYAFDIFLYSVEGEDQVLIDRFSSGTLSIESNFIKEFSVAKLEDIGMHVRFVVFDSTPYFPGMKPLALFAWPNGKDDTPKSIRFTVNTGDNLLMKRFQFDVERFKSCVFEFDTLFMRNKLLY